MEDTRSALQVEPPQPSARQVWQEPAILLERSLLAEAQDPAPTRRAGRTRGDGFLGPLGASGGSGLCTT